MSFFLISFFRWLNFFSLDVVFIALAWQEVFARTAAVTLRWEERVLLGIAIWMIYIIDHSFDAIVSIQNSNSAPRHHYVRSHRALFRRLLLLPLIPTIWLLGRLSSNLLIAGALLSCLAGAYLLFNHLILRGGSWLKGRELMISLIFSLGCGLAPVVQSRQSWILLAWMIAFALVALVNCTLIARMERHVPLNALAPKCFFSPQWIIGLYCAVMFFSFFSPLIGKALCWSLLGLALVPITARHCGYEIASLAADQVLFFGALLALFR